jgi:tetratricopeptide (TPR) repeat protein
MGRSASENAFLKGQEAARRGAFLEALAYFEASVYLARRHEESAVPMKYLSYYGWCLAMSSDRLQEAMSVCEAAARAEFYDPEIRLNLGRVYLRAGDRGLAFGTFVSGLRLSPDHPHLKTEIRRLGIRRRPVVQFLARSHPVNRILGLWRGGLGGSGSKRPGARARSI